MTGADPREGLSREQIAYLLRLWRRRAAIHARTGDPTGARLILDIAHYVRRELQIAREVARGR